MENYFEGNPYRDLGLEYFAWEDFKTKDGKMATRWVLQTEATEDQMSEIAKYPNLKIVKSGARYRWDPQRSYDVLYQIHGEGYEPDELRETEKVSEEPEVAEETVDEDFVEDTYGLEPSDTSEVNNYYDESDQVWDNSEFGGSVYDRVLPAMELANSLRTLYEDLAKVYPDKVEIFSGLAQNCLDQLEQLKTVLDVPTTVNNNEGEQI